MSRKFSIVEWASYLYSRAREGLVLLFVFVFVIVVVVLVFDTSMRVFV